MSPPGGGPGWLEVCEEQEQEEQEQEEEDPPAATARVARREDSREL